MLGRRMPHPVPSLKGLDVDELPPAGDRCALHGAVGTGDWALACTTNCSYTRRQPTCCARISSASPAAHFSPDCSHCHLLLLLRPSSTCPASGCPPAPSKHLSHSSCGGQLLVGQAPPPSFLLSTAVFRTATQPIPRCSLWNARTPAPSPKAQSAGCRLWWLCPRCSRACSWEGAPRHSSFLNVVVTPLGQATSSSAAAQLLGGTPVIRCS
jgi:hypothetical protein